MSRAGRLIRILACRTGLRTGKSVVKSGALPLTESGTFGGFPLEDYRVFGATAAGRTAAPTRPVPLSNAGAATFSDGGTGLSLVFSTSDSSGVLDRFTASFPGIEPLRAVSGVSDEIGYRDGKLIRRVGVCRAPVAVSGLEASFGTDYPAVSLLVGDGTTVAAHPYLVSSHWKEIRADDVTDGAASGMRTIDGVLFANLPRALYRRYVTGATGATTVTGTAPTPSVPAGEYRCDFFDGTSRVFTLPSDLYGSAGCRDVLAVSRAGATLVKRTLRFAFTGSEEPEVLSDYRGTGESLFRLAKTDFGAAANGVSPVCGSFSYVAATPTEMIGSHGSAPAFCEDETYWYFHIPGMSLLAEFQSYLCERAQAGTPAVLVYAAAQPETVVLTSRLAETASVGTITTLSSVGAVGDDLAFDSDAALTLVPAFSEFVDEERDAGRGVEILYVLPSVDVTETELELPPLHAGAGTTTFTAAAAQAGGLDPATGSFTVLKEN